MSQPIPVSTSDAPAAIGPYSQAVRWGEFVFCSGQIALDPATGELVAGGVEAETRRALENLRAVLAAAESGLDRALRLTVYLIDMDEFPRMNAVYETFFDGGAPPARAAVEVAALPKGARVEIDCIALVR